MTSPGPFRSDKVLRHAKGQPCTLRISERCDQSGETTVSCHVRDEHKGMGQKASDHSIVFGCANCHRLLDEGFGEWMHAFVVRALQETWAILIRDGIIVFPHNVAVPHHDKPVKPRKPKAERRAVPQGRALESHSTFPPKGSRKIQSNNPLRKNAK